MGLDFHPNCNAHWSYSGFNAFRKRLALEIGLDLKAMKGFSGDIPWSITTDAIKDLLNHSDCDGELTPEQCNIIAPRLRELIEDWDADDYDKQQASLLANGMADCARQGVPLEFC